MATEIHSAKMSQVKGTPNVDLKSDNVQTPTEEITEASDVDFLAQSVPADPESFNVCISCD